MNDFADTPPHDLGAEQAVLGGMLHSQDAFADVTEIITGRDFYRPAHPIIWESLLGLYERGEPTDPVSVQIDLIKRGEIARMGGAPYLHTLMEGASYANAAYFARIVREKAILRRVIEGGTRIVQLGYKADADAADVVDRARAEIDKVITDEQVGAQPIDELCWGVINDLEHDAPRGLATGITDLDYCLLGLSPGDMVVAGARPGMGKSVFALGIGAHVAIRLGLPVLITSLEMSAKELMTRLLSAEAGVPLRAIQKRDLTEDYWQRIAKAQNRIASAPLKIDDYGNANLAHCRSQLRKMKRTTPAALWIIDYLQLMPSSGKAENRQVEVSALSRGIKLLAREFNIPVIAVAQLNRGPEQRSDKRPLLADLRESGSLEQDSDKVILLHREDAYDAESPRAGEIDLHVAKHRQGPTGIITAAWQGDYSRIKDMARI